MNNQEIAERISERLIRPSDYSVDLSLPMGCEYKGVMVDQAFALFREGELGDTNEIDRKTEQLRSMVVRAVLEVLEIGGGTG